MWRKSLFHCVKVIQYDDNRIIGLQVQTQDLLFLCIYLPYECDNCYDDYCFYMNTIKCIIESYYLFYVILMPIYSQSPFLYLN